MHPQRAAVHEYLYPLSQRVYEMHGGVELETNQVDDGVPVKGRNCATERCFALGRRSIDDYAFY